MQPSERARVAGVGEGGGAAESAGLVLEDLEVVIELDGLPVAFDDPLMPGHDLPAVDLAECQAEHAAEMAGERPWRLLVGEVPQLHGVVGTAADGHRPPVVLPHRHRPPKDPEAAKLRSNPPISLAGP